MIKRYEMEVDGGFYSPEPDDDGMWVAYDDHAAEVEAVKEIARQTLDSADAINADLKDQLNSLKNGYLAAADKLARLTKAIQDWRDNEACVAWAMDSRDPDAADHSLGMRDHYERAICEIAGVEWEVVG